MRSRLQRAGRGKVKRTEHVWHPRRRGGWVCVLCGAVHYNPPPHPAPAEWVPEFYEPLTDKLRALCPPEVGIEQ